MKKISLIGATGSVGRQVVKTVLAHPDEYRIVAVCSRRGGDALEEIARVTGAEYSAAADEDKAAALRVAEYGGADLVFNAACGFAGLEYSLAALAAGKTLALANKETLVCGGEIVMPLVKDGGLLPVDSEHSAIWQCLNFDLHAPFERLIITASGGPFRGIPYSQLSRVTPAQALAHPTWKMGAKITVDSATLLNKGYEVIEAHHLFSAPYSRITTVIQPQSIIHSMVEFRDGAVLAQASCPTMELPVQLALSYPQRLAASAPKLDFTRKLDINFLPLDGGLYPLYSLAAECGKAGGVMPCALNAASETAVEAFLSGRISFTRIAEIADGVVQATPFAPAESFLQLSEVDALSRRLAGKLIT